MARMGVHLQGARRARQEAQQAGQARNALDAFGYASITVHMGAPGSPNDGKLIWQTPLARELLLRYYGTSAPQTPEPVLNWLRRHLADAHAHIEPPRLAVELGPRRLTFRLHQQTGDSDASGEDGSSGGSDWLIVMREISDDAVLETMSLSFKLTAREAEVLYWVVKGKINRDIAGILGASPATVKKHLERVYAKLGVETRTAAAGMAVNCIRQFHPQFEC